MASRLRNGERLPSIITLARVVMAFDLADDLLADWVRTIAERGPEGSGDWLRRTIFDAPAA